MLKTHRNELYNALIESLPFDMSYMDYQYDEKQEIYDYLRIWVKHTKLAFAARSRKDNYHSLSYAFNIYHSPGIDTENWRNASISVIRDSLKHWCKENLAKWYEESVLDASQEDLWSVHFLGQKQLNFNQVDFQDQDYFSHDEKKQIIMSLDTIRLKIKETDSLQLSEEGLKLIDQRIEYLKSATDKLNKFEWKSVLISTIISIIIALSLDTTKGEALIGIFKQAFTFVPKLLGLD